MVQLEISHAQLSEIWAADEPTAKGILSRMAKQHNYATDLRQSIYVDYLHSTLGFAKTSGLSPAKALTVFSVVVETHAKACGAQAALSTRLCVHPRALLTLFASVTSPRRARS